MKNAVWIAINICVLVNATPSQNTLDEYMKKVEEGRERMRKEFQGVDTASGDHIMAPGTTYLSDPREREFSPEEEIKYQFRDKLQLNSNYR